jgi:hypothetical protein
MGKKFIGIGRNIERKWREMSKKFIDLACTSIFSVDQGSKELPAKLH